MPWIELTLVDGTVVRIPQENHAALGIVLRTLRPEGGGLSPRRGMLSLPSSIRIFVHALPTDMRKSFDGLSAIVSQAFGKNVLEGDYFVFVNRCGIDARFCIGTATGWSFGRSDWNAGLSSARGGDAASLCVEIDSA